MENYLLIEKSKFSVTSSSENDKYTLEGVFTEFDSENRNGRVYTKKEFQPHFDSLKKVVESGTAVGELDHPKQFETTLKNASHKIEDIWMDEANNRVMGKIKLLDTDAGRNAKALVDAGIPLHISSRAAGTVSENKQVKMHKLFTYDLVDTPGFANARLSSCNESFGMLNENTEHDVFSDFAIYEVGKQIKQDISELNNKNKENDTMDYIKESEFNKYTNFTKDAITEVKYDIQEMKEIQESIIEQNDSIVDEYNNADFKSKINTVNEKLTAIEKWAEHVKEEFDNLSETQAPLAKADALQVGTDYKGKGTITQVEVQDDGSTKVYLDSDDEPIIVGKTKVDNVIDDETLQEKYNILEAKFEAMVKWSEHVTETVSGMENWSEHVTETVSALEDWSDHSTETVSGMEKWTDHVTESVTAIEKWSDHVTESVSLLEGTKVNNKQEKINENTISDFRESIYSKLEGILEAKEQKATDNKSLNESKSENDLNEAKNEQPLWLENIPAKYKETWKGLVESEKTRITKRANLFEFKTTSAIKSFWDNELTKENLIKEDKTEDKIKLSNDQLTEARLAKLRGFRMV